MVMVFGPPGRALLVIIGHLLFFSDILQLAQGLPFDFNQTTSSIDLEKRAPGGRTWTSPGKYTNIRLADSCAGKEKFFETTFDDMSKMVSDAKKTIPTIEKALNKDRKKMLPTEKSYVDIYQSLYGMFDLKKKAKVDNAKRKLQILSDFVGKYDQGLSRNQFHFDIYCDGTDWQDSGKKSKDGDAIMVLQGDPLAHPTLTENPTDICLEANGDKETLAFVTTSTNKSKDYMTICPKAWNEWQGKDTLATKQSKALKSLLGETIDDLVNETPESVLLHELTHAQAFFGASVLDDRKVGQEDPDDDDAYEWDLLTKLADEDKDVAQPKGAARNKDIRPLDNADTSMFFLSGLYLSAKGNWGNGICRDPKKVA
ncbi:hypothetical protein E8E15_008120 [Penicillium rubens]|uniref:uncharacterized protein n=1 Tax=Penicillium rubens TaxID=1108849 RepID=UPI001E165FEC|nr:uncharacterized protein N7525_000158 [Penicillium rubens]KAF3024569.1 hypothetical protein E8E15_008120 [Penicillium rubens]KAJ5842417.1 hypothetical protein N7525_000158 [Penicillium rubens]KAJ5847010.1 hypothetical protein N7534_010679 [Penicillium rubens]